MPLTRLTPALPLHGAPSRARGASRGSGAPGGAGARSHVRALLTGGTGFVGAAVARALLREGWQVRALVRPTSDRRNLPGLALETVRGRPRRCASLERAAGGCEALFHVAADYRLGARNPQRAVSDQRRGHAQHPERRPRAPASSASSTPAASPRSASRRTERPGTKRPPSLLSRHDRPLQALEVPGRTGGARGRARGHFRWSSSTRPPRSGPGT